MVPTREPRRMEESWTRADRHSGSRQTWMACRLPLRASAGFRPDFPYQRAAIKLSRSVCTEDSMAVNRPDDGIRAGTARDPAYAGSPSVVPPGRMP